LAMVLLFFSSCSGTSTMAYKGNTSKLKKMNKRQPVNRQYKKMQISETRYMRRFARIYAKQYPKHYIELVSSPLFSSKTN
jgi:hypothetical protein